MSRYLLNKFLYTVDRDAELVERYRSEPGALVEWWEAERANAILNVHDRECSTWLKFDDTEREALADLPIVPVYTNIFAPPLPQPKRYVQLGKAIRELVEWWEAERANTILNVHQGECSTWLKFDDTEREALVTHDFPKLFELGAHPFLTLTLFIAMFERDYDEPLGFQLEYARRLSHFTLPYPDIST